MVVIQHRQPSPTGRKPANAKLNSHSPQRSKGRSTRDLILEKALELFAARGYAATSVRALTRAVGLTESSLYNYFEGKEAILTTLVSLSSPARSAARLRSEPYRKLGNDPEAFCRFHAAAKLADWTDPRELLFIFLLNAERQRLKREREVFMKAWFVDELGVMEQYFQGFAQQGLIRTVDPYESARMFMAGLTFIRQEYLHSPEGPMPAKIRPQIARYLEYFLDLVLTQQAAIGPQALPPAVDRA